MTIIGTIIAWHMCHNFDCRRMKKRLGAKCVIESNFNPNAHFGDTVGTSIVFGRTFDMHWFQMGGEGNAFHGQTGGETLTIFMGQRHAYFSMYSTREDYERVKCGW